MHKEELSSKRLQRDETTKSVDNLTIDSTNKSTARSIKSQRKFNPKLQAQIRRTPVSAKRTVRKSSTNTSQIKPQKPSRPMSAASVVKSKPDLDFTKIPNFKYEVEKLLRAVFRHSVNCPDMKEELRRIGSSKLLDEYVRCRHSANA